MLQFGLPEISHGKHLWKKNVQHCRVPKNYHAETTLQWLFSNGRSRLCVCRSQKIKTLKGTGNKCRFRSDFFIVTPLWHAGVKAKWQWFLSFVWYFALTPIGLHYGAFQASQTLEVQCQKPIRYRINERNGNNNKHQETIRLPRCNDEWRQAGTCTILVCIIWG